MLPPSGRLFIPGPRTHDRRHSARHDVIQTQARDEEGERRRNVGGNQGADAGVVCTVQQGPCAHSSGTVL